MSVAVEGSVARRLRAQKADVKADIRNWQRCVICGTVAPAALSLQLVCFCQRLCNLPGTVNEQLNRWSERPVF
jgi:hypothetical protein